MFGGAFVELSEMVINAAQMYGAFYQILMFDCRFKEVLNNLKIFVGFRFSAKAQIDDSQEVHYVGQVINRERFGGIVVGELGDGLFQQIAFLNFLFFSRRIQCADYGTVNQVCDRGRKFFGIFKNFRPADKGCPRERRMRSPLFRIEGYFGN